MWAVETELARWRARTRGRRESPPALEREVIRLIVVAVVVTVAVMTLVDLGSLFATAAPPTSMPTPGL